MFAIIGPVDGMAVLDLFAGSGALGVEALSRGARTVTFVDRAPSAVAAIRANCAMVDDPSRVRILAMDWQGALRHERAAGRIFELCLADPPYSVLPRIAGRLGPALAPVLASGATLVVEHAPEAGPVDLPGLPVAARQDRTYGGTGIAVFRLGETA
jgi:16S rRNA (guanine966-N2)-methyltransferase